MDKNKYLSELEQKILLSYWKGRLTNRGKRTYTLILFSLGTGLRAGEIADTKITDLQLTGEFPSVTVRTLKNGDCHPVYISNSLAKYLKRYIKGHKSEYLFPSETMRKQTPAGLWYLWSHALRKAGLQHYKLHSTRHTFGTNIYRKSKCIRTTQLQLRHKSLSSTQIYSHVQVEDISRIMNSL